MRRRALLLAAVAALAACSGSDRVATGTTSTASTSTTTVPTTTATTAAVGNPTSSGSTLPVAPDPTAPEPEPAGAFGLQGVVDRFASAQAVGFGVVVVDLSTGERADHLAGRVVLSASLYKLFVARELLRQVDDGQITAADPMGDAQGRTVEECITAMIVVSDNDCGEAGLDRVGYGALDGSIHAAGYGSTSLATPQRTSADDIALFLTRARAGTVVGDGHGAASAKLYRLLAAQQVNDRLPLGLPPGTPIAHKTGDRLGWAHDAGVITTPRGEVLLVVLSGPWALPCCDAERPGPAEQQAFGAIAALATAVYDYTTSAG